MARGIARMVIAAAKKRAGVTPGAVKRITPAAAKRIAAFKPFGPQAHRAMTRLATGGMAKAPRAPRPFGLPRAVRRRSVRVK